MTCVIYLPYFKPHVCWLHPVTRLIHEPHPYRGHCKQRSNLFPTDLSPPVTYLTNLLGTYGLAAFMQPELFRV